MALLLVGLSLLGLYMTSLPDAGFDKSKVLLVIYHKEFGMAALIATHNPDLAARMDRTVTLREGKLVAL